MKKIGWIHPKDESDQWDGFNEPGIEHFSGSPIRHLAREVVQNSIDSHNEDIQAPVRVHFNEIYIKPSEIPDFEELKQTLLLCLTSSEDESAKSKQFFESALKELEKPKIKILEISDFNTKGMRGPVKNGTPYFAFMKAKGQSKKSSDTAAGSFGIGKFAPYAVSKLRTVFVSTIFQEDDGNFTQYTQGKSILMSHDDQDGVRHLGIGFWGVIERCQPVEGACTTHPSWMVRSHPSDHIKNEVGTKLIILGFDGNAGWQESLAASIVENFFGAIHSEKLEVKIQNKFLINHSTIKDIFSNPDIAKAIENEKNEPEQFQDSSDYYTCITNHQDSYIETHQNLHLGLCELKIFIREGLPKKVSFLRNGMFISDSLSIAGLKSFSEFKDFAAVFQCKDKKGIELLRAMEPPKHDDFEPDRLPSKEEQAKARKALKEMAAWIRDMLRRRAKDPVSEITKLDELKEFFADDSESGKGDGNEEINPFGNISIKAKPVPHKKPPSANSGVTPASDGAENTEGEGGGGESDAGGSDGAGGEGNGQGGEGGGAASRVLAPMENLRAVVSSPNSRKLAFTPLNSGVYELSLYESGADSEYSIEIVYASSGIVSKGKLRIEAKCKERTVLEVQLAEDFEGAIKVVAHEI